MSSVVESGDYDGGSHVYATCKQCNQSFENKTSLAKHMYLHREGFICMLCNKPFASESGLKRHINANHKNSKPIPSCDICGQRFRIKRDLEKHHLDCHRADKYFQCRFCGAEFSWLTNLQKHEQFHENGIDQSNNESTITENSMILTDFTWKRKSMPSKDSNQDKPFKCQVCGKEFQFDFSYAIHLEGHKKALEMESSEIDTSVANSSTNHDNKSSVEILLEVVPNESSANGEEIVSMKALGENEMTDVGICERDVSSDTSMTRSNFLTDEEDVELFNYLKECKMKREIRMVRKRRPESPIYDCVMTEEKPYKCNLCGELFRWEVSLAIHAKVHVDGKALKFRKVYQKQDKPALRPKTRHSTKFVTQKFKDKGGKAIDEDESLNDEDDDDDYKNEDDNSNSMEIPVADQNENAPVLSTSSAADDVSVVQKVPQTSDKDTAAKADKFLERMTDVLKTKWNPANSKSLPSQKKKIVGQVLLLDNNNKKLLLKDGKLVSEDGTHYLVSDGLLYMVNSQSNTRIEEPVMSLMNDYVEPPSYTDMGRLSPDPDSMIDPECDLSMNATDA